MKTSFQQLMIGSLCKNEAATKDVLRSVKAMGYDEIELNGFMTHPTSFFVRMLTKLAGMPTGKAGKYDWKKLVRDAGLGVTSIHFDLGTLERDLTACIQEAKDYSTSRIVVTGMYRFDYSDLKALEELSARLNKVGEQLAQSGIELLYHNHNVEFKRVGEKNQFAYEILTERLNPDWVNFEFDSYWAAEAGVNVYSLMRRLGKRLKLHHINDRGSKEKGPYMTPIIKNDSMELGTGTMDLETLLQIDREAGVDTVILETHRNFIDGSPLRSLEISGQYLHKHAK
ncbi:MAG: TIM barrel protein [Candidatus Enteromonas sp.]|nr:TIM barrel protein [Candidatus Enteromonas sp.]